MCYPYRWGAPPRRPAAAVGRPDRGARTAVKAARRANRNRR